VLGDGLRRRVADLTSPLPLADARAILLGHVGGVLGLEPGDMDLIRLEELRNGSSNESVFGETTPSPDSVTTD